jgi:hypothetical protein
MWQEEEKGEREQNPEPSANLQMTSSQVYTTINGAKPYTLLNPQKLKRLVNRIGKIK